MEPMHITSSSMDEETIPALADETADYHKSPMVKLLAFVAVVGCFFVIGLLSNSNDAVDEAKGTLLITKSDAKASTVAANAEVELPSYLTVLGQGDDYDHRKYNVTSTNVVAPPGEGKIIPGKARVVRFNQPGFVYRTYGGNANQCGYWWTLNPPSDTYTTYAQHYAMCNTFNDIEYIVRCRVDTNFTAVVGPGQSLNCGGILVEPDPTALQLNANVCQEAVVLGNHLPCEYCTAKEFLQNSACSNTAADYIDGSTFPPGNR